MYTIGTLVLLQALFATTAIINKKLILYAHPLYITTLELFIVGLLVTLFKQTSNPHKNHTVFFSGLMFAQLALITVIRHILKYWGLLHVPAMKVSILLTSTPCFIALFSQIAFKKMLSKAQLFALGITCFGMYPVLITHGSLHDFTADFFSFTLPDLAVCGAIILYSISAVIMQLLIRNHHYQSYVIYGSTSLLGGIFGIATLAYFPQYHYITDAHSFFAWFFLLLVIGKLLCSLAYYRMFHYYSATFIGLSDCLSPLFVGIYSCVLLQEIPTWHYAVSFIIMTVGIFLFYRSEL